jgi:hypothetical protein
MNDMTYVCLSRNKNNPSSDGTDRPLNHYVSFIGFILLTKSLSCNDAILTGILNYFRSLHIFRVLFSNMESVLL